MSSTGFEDFEAWRGTSVNVDIEEVYYRSCVEGVDLLLRISYLLFFILLPPKPQENIRE
jgi:hypothetical protein